MTHKVAENQGVDIPRPLRTERMAEGVDRWCVARQVGSVLAEEVELGFVVKVIQADLGSAWIHRDDHRN